MIKNFKDVQVSLAKTNVLPSFSPERELKTIKEKQFVIKTDVEKVISVDQQIIELNLKADKSIESSSGFLIEIFLSGTDGKLTKLLQNELNDLHGNVVEQGFEEYLFLELK